MKYKILIKDVMKETTIGSWINPVGYKLPIVYICNPMFEASINVAFGKYKEFRRFILEQYDVELEAEEPKAIFIWFRNRKDDGKMTYFLNIQDNNWLAEDYGTIVHELHHFIHYSMDEIGIKRTKESEEVFAYSIGYFMERIVRAFIQYKKKYDKKRK